MPHCANSVAATFEGDITFPAAYLADAGVLRQRNLVLLQTLCNADPDMLYATARDRRIPQLLSDPEKQNRQIFERSLIDLQTRVNNHLTLVSTAGENFHCSMRF